MSSTQLTFTLRTSSNVKTVHLVGNWDSYRGQIPLSKDSSKTGGWKGTFKFQGSTLKPGQRYWYYYVVDGYHVSHDPSQPSTTEPTTGRQLNILDVAKSGASSSSRSTTTRGHDRRTSKDIPKGRGLSPSRIACPRPQKPHETRHLRAGDYSGHNTVEEMTRKFAAQQIQASSFSSSEDEYSDSEIDSDVSSLPSLSHSTGSRSPTSSLSSGSASPTFSHSSRSSSVSSSSSCCTCERYGITRRGDRVRLDCGGSRCGASASDSSSCASSDDEYETSKRAPVPSATRRQGVVVRGGRR